MTNDPEKRERQAGWVIALMRWFAAHRRPMPWRDQPTPYAVWISEVMLQQTQVATAMPYFARFMRCFPDVQTLAAAPLDAVLKTWEGLGYYARARNLHRAAQQIVGTFGGYLPVTAERLKALPGLGDYAAAAIASIVHGEPVPAVDGNVLRVIARFRGLTDDIAKPATRRRVYGLLLPHIRRAAPGDFNQALMELGALVCRPRQPLCRACPLAPACVAHRSRRTEQLPIKTRPAMGPHVEVVVGLVRHRNRVLLSRRPPTGLLGGLWEFPGGKRGGEATRESALVHALATAAGIAVKPGERLGTIPHAFSHFRITAHVFACSRLTGRLRPGGDSVALAWVTVPQLADYALTKVARQAATRFLRGAN